MADPTPGEILATLWRQAEQRLRTRLLELELKSGG